MSIAQCNAREEFALKSLCRITSLSFVYFPHPFPPQNRAWRTPDVRQRLCPRPPTYPFTLSLLHFSHSYKYIRKKKKKEKPKGNNNDIVTIRNTISIIVTRCPTSRGGTPFTLGILPPKYTNSNVVTVIIITVVIIIIISLFYYYYYYYYYCYHIITTDCNRYHPPLISIISSLITITVTTSAITRYIAK